jgi:hypothetical protein
MSGKVKPGCLEELERLMREVVLPASAEQHGYKGGWGLVDPSTRNGMLVTFWATARDLEETECSGFLTSQLSRVSQYLDGPAIRETFNVILEHQLA